MTLQLGILATLVVMAALVLGRLARAWLKYRGARIVTCPESQKPAGVVVNARHAAATCLAAKEPDLRLSSCSRWPERANCGQQCLAQIAAAPEDCRVRTILARWYAGQVCAGCGQPIGEIQWGASEPALLQTAKVSVAWSEVPADKLLGVLAASSPLCFACHMANTLVREHPELVVERSANDPI